MRHGGGSSQPGDTEKHFKTWEGRFLSTGSVGDNAKVKTFETALGLNQAASRAPQPGLFAAAAGSPATDIGSGGGGTDAAGSPAAGCGGRGGAGNDAQVTELARKISAMEAQIEKLEHRNGILEDSIRSRNSKLAYQVLKQCA